MKLWKHIDTYCIRYCQFNWTAGNWPQLVYIGSIYTRECKICMTSIIKDNGSKKLCICSQPIQITGSKRQKRRIYFSLLWDFVVESIREFYLTILLNFFFIPKYRIVALNPLFYTIHHSLYICKYSLFILFLHLIKKSWF